MRILFRNLSFGIILTALVCGCRIFGIDETDLTVRQRIENQIKAVECDNALRLRTTKELFDKSGALNDIAIERFGNVYNVVATVKGESDETIVIGAHYDKTTLGCGAIDNWTGVVILANLLEAFKKSNNHKTLKFVAFGKEEIGLLGSKAMADAIQRQSPEKYCAMVNLDSFGFTEIWALESISDRSLIEIAGKIASRRGVDFAVKEYPGASSDSHAFRDAGIPAVTFSGLDENWRDYLHGKNDVTGAVNPSAVFESYLFALEVVKEIDRKPCRSFR